MNKHLFRKTKKIFLGLLLLASSVTVSSCSMFFGGDDYAISAVSKSVDEETGDTIVTIQFQNEEIEPLTFTIPTVTNGIGIEKIDATNNENNVTLKITYTDGSTQDITVPVIDGKDGKGVVNVSMHEDENGEKYIQFEYTDGSFSEKLYLPKGDNGVGIKGVSVVPNPDGSSTYTMSFSDGRDDVVWTVRNGVSVTDIYLNPNTDPESDTYELIINYSDKSSDSIFIEKPRATIWHSGSGAPSNNTNLKPNSGDFYVDLDSGWVYTYSDIEGRVARFCIKGQKDPEQFAVNFHISENEKATWFSKVYNEGDIIIVPADGGSTVKLSTIPVPEKNGYEFEGWYSDATNPNSGQFTDMTIVNSDLDLYARWSVAE